MVVVVWCGLVVFSSGGDGISFFLVFFVVVAVRSGGGSLSTLLFFFLVFWLRVYHLLSYRVFFFSFCQCRHIFFDLW